MNGLLRTDVKIADVNLAKIFKISIEKFDAICESLIHESNESDWHLNEGEHFQVTNQAHNARSFTPEGVILLAKYVEEEIDGRNIFRKIVSLIDRSRAKLVQALVITRVSDLCENADQKNIIIRNGRAFVTTRETRRILRLHTRQDILEKARRYEQRGDSGRAPMQPNKHFLQVPDYKHELYSADGIKRLSMGLQSVCKSKTTKTWNKAVERTIYQALNEVAMPYLLEDKKLARVMNTAKNLAGNTCELTGSKTCKATPNVELCSHHLYDKTSYPGASQELVNIIVIDKIWHKKFHEHMGGTGKSCTPEDFKDWVLAYSHEIYADSEFSINYQAKAINSINKRIKMLSPLFS